MEDRLLTEVQRQQKYLDELGPEFTFPLFNPKHAMESQRRNGYRNTAAAAREIVDNAIEAGAKKVHVVFDRGATGKAYGRTETVTSVAFIDDGAGMLPEMARCALCLGGGTHFNEANFIGKFGFGLPNSSINQTKHVEVYTKTAETSEIVMTYLDVNEVQQGGMHSIPQAKVAKLPKFVQKHFEKNGTEFQHGTIVVWVDPDRLTYRSGGLLKEHLVDDFGVVYRYLLDNFELEVDGVLVEKVDPLFLDPKARLYKSPEDGGAKLIRDWSIPVKLMNDGERGMRHLLRVEEGEDLANNPDVVAVGAIDIRISNFPVGFAEREKQYGEEANKRLAIKTTRPGISFVRANREIDTVTSMPRSQRDKSGGLGQWPLLQGYIYHMGMEVRFSPQMDEAFGITNDKQSVRPMEDFWKLVTKEEVDRVFSATYRAHPAERLEIREAAKRLKAERTVDPSPAEKAAATADLVQGVVPKAPEAMRPKLKEKLEEVATARAGVTGETLEEVKKALEKEAKFRPYVIDYFEDPNGPFYEPEWDNWQLRVKINKKHPFFETLYVATLDGSEAGVRLKYGLDVMLIMLSKAELATENDDTRLIYEAQRRGVWSSFLRNSLKVLERALREDEVEEPMEDQAEATA